MCDYKMCPCGGTFQTVQLDDEPWRSGRTCDRCGRDSSALIECPACWGSGCGLFLPNGDYTDVECSLCSGWGRVYADRPDVLAAIQEIELAA